jgi:hypothetical protein
VCANSCPSAWHELAFQEESFILMQIESVLSSECPSSCEPTSWYLLLFVVQCWRRGRRPLSPPPPPPAFERSHVLALVAVRGPVLQIYSRK